MAARGVRKELAMSTDQRIIFRSKREGERQAAVAVTSERVNERGVCSPAAHLT